MIQKIKNFVRNFPDVVSFWIGLTLCWLFPYAETVFAYVCVSISILIIFTISENRRENKNVKRI